MSPNRRGKVFCVLAAISLAAMLPAHAAHDFGAGELLGSPKKGTDPIDRYSGSIQVALLMCSVAQRLNNTVAEGQKLGTEIPSETAEMANYEECIAQYKRTLRTIYEKTTSTMKKPVARAALKEHFIQAIVSLEGIAPNTDEMRISYKTRQNQNEAKLKELWTRFEIER